MITQTSPAYLAELAHQEHSVGSRLRWLRVPTIVVLTTLVITALLVARMRFRLPYLVWVTPSALLILLAYGMQFLIILRTLVLASNAIVREREAGTLNLLRLTGMGPRALIRGKWLATLRTMYVDTLVLAMLRVGLMIGLGTQWGPSDSALIALACLSVSVLSLLELIFSAALGVAISALAPTRCAATIGAILGRGLLVVIAVMSGWQLFLGPGWLNVTSGVTYDRGFVYTMLVLGDNGTLVSAWLASAAPGVPLPLLLRAIIIGIATFCLLSMVLLLSAEYVNTFHERHSPTL